MSDELEFLRRRVREYVARGLDQACGPVAPAVYGPSIRRSLTLEEQAELHAFGDALLDELFTREAREQTKGGEGPDEPELFPLDTWIAAAESGKRVRYRHAHWIDHQAHREHQITNVRRVTRAFDVEESRRERLAAAGMLDDPNMTTEDALRVLGEEAA